LSSKDDSGEPEESENVLIINIPEGKDKPYKCSSGFYLRQGANSQKMNRDEIIEFINGEGKLKFDKSITDIKEHDSKTCLRIFR